MSTAKSPAHLRFPYLTCVLIGLYAGIFLSMWLQQSQQDLLGPGLISKSTWFNVTTIVRWGAIQSDLVQNGQWWRLITALFLHADPAHVLCNGFVLLLVGTFVESRYGAGALLTLYLLTGVAANAGSVWSTSKLMLQLGGSGAIFGIYGFSVIQQFLGGSKERWRVVQTFAISLALGVVLTRWYPIDNTAHMVGAVAGLLLGGIAYVLPPRAVVWLGRIFGIAGLALLVWVVSLQREWAAADRAAQMAQLETIKADIRRFAVSLNEYAQLNGQVQFQTDDLAEAKQFLDAAELFLQGTEWQPLIVDLQAVTQLTENNLMTDAQREAIRAMAAKHAALLNTSAAPSEASETNSPPAEPPATP